MNNYKIEELIPQREPFIMVNELISFNAKSFTSSLLVTSDNFFAKNNFFQEEGIIENFAQTAAAGAGYSFKVNSQEVKLGYIGAIKNVVINFLPEVNTTITTTIELVGKVMNVDIVEGKVVGENGDIIATAEMKIFIDK